MKIVISFISNNLILIVINVLMYSCGNFDLTAQVIMDELNGSSLGKSYGITYVPTPNGQGASFTKVNESRLEYSFESGLPNQGTIEMLIKVFNGYSYENYKFKDEENSAIIFSTNPSDVWYFGAMWLSVNQNGDIRLTTAIGNKEEKSHDLSATSTSFRFNEWHTISFSYGSLGQYIKVDGKQVAANPLFNENLATCGGTRGEKDIPTIGEVHSVIWPNNRYDHGFYGVLDRFRASSTQQDWVLNLANNNLVKEISPDNDRLPANVATSLAFDDLLSGTWVTRSGSTFIAENSIVKMQKPSDQAIKLGFKTGDILNKYFEWDGTNFYCLSKIKGSGKEEWIRSKITIVADSLLFDYLDKGKVLNFKPYRSSLFIIKKNNITLTNKIKGFVEGRINVWQVKGEFEKTQDYLIRVNEKSRNLKIEEFQNEAIAFYKKLYALKITPSDFTLASYDADNESFLIKSHFLGEFVLPVPLDEAQTFKQKFDEMRFSNLDFGIKDESFVLSHIEYKSPLTNKVYVYDSKNKVNYNITKIKYEFDSINVDLKNEPIASIDNLNKSTTTISVGKSDVDVGIPTISINGNQNRFALIIGNEDYKSFQPDLNSEVNVLFAENDARTFKEYTVKTLGFREENITLLINASAGRMNQAISKMNLIAKNSSGKAELIFYYAGHGLPDENTKEPYLIPVDVSGANFTEGGIKLSTVYEKLTQYPSQKVSVFIDACFTGGARNQQLLSARSVKMKPKEQALVGNIVVFSASSGEQSSLPYKEKQHGMFTYYLLKKIQETKGEVSMNDLSNYVKDQVGLQSVNINNKEQTPVVNAGIDTWGNWKLR